MNRSIVIIATSSMIVLASACGASDASSDSAPPVAESASPTASTTVPAVATNSTDTAPATTTTTATATKPTPTTSTVVVTTAAPQLEQPAIWPAPDVVFDTPEAAAADFVTAVLRVPATLGTFRQGDQRSGEIDVLSPGEGAGTTPVVRGTLALRRLGADDGWFVLGAPNDNASITSLDVSSAVAAGLQTVAGRARGFEASVVVSAFEAGNVDNQFDQVVTMAGSGLSPEPYEVSLDLGGALPGQTVVLLVQGGAGLETDPGDFGAIAVTISTDRGE